MKEFIDFIISSKVYEDEFIKSKFEEFVVQYPELQEKVNYETVKASVYIMAYVLQEYHCWHTERDTLPSHPGDSSTNHKLSN